MKLSINLENSFLHSNSTVKLRQGNSTSREAHRRSLVSFDIQNQLCPRFRKDSKRKSERLIKKESLEVKISQTPPNVSH